MVYGTETPSPGQNGEPEIVLVNIESWVDSRYIVAVTAVLVVVVHPLSVAST